ncbi:acyl carrier protein [Streptomyces sp. NPDC050535]|uniref:acyl carrier protein n=1 Tax=Streptomyces sp. NPDC050535 TaxID=3365626 RepID=UPI0037993265
MPESSNPHGYDEVIAELTGYVEARFLPEGEGGLQPRTPLLEWGILTSLTTTELISFILDRYGVSIPPEKIVGAHFKNLDAISRLVVSLQGDPAGRP